MVAARLARVDAALGSLDALTPLQRAVRTAGLLTERAKLTGRDADLFAADAVANRLIEEGVRHDDLVHTLVMISLDSHDLDRADRLLASSPRLAATPRGVLASSAIHRERGEYIPATRALLDVLRIGPTWNAMAALACVFADLGDVHTADVLFVTTQDDIDALQMWSFAWVEVQRAREWRRAGDLGRALVHLQRAEAAWPDWRVREERGRWLLASGDAGEAAEVLRDLATTTERPDHFHAFGDALRSVNDPDAQRAYERALHGYTACPSASRYRHHLAEYHLYVSGDLDTALTLARDDVHARPNVRTRRLLAAVHSARGEQPASNELLNDIEAQRGEQLRAVRLLGESGIGIPRCT